MQIRLRHAMGGRMLELPARGQQQPVVVGRSAQADVPVPSVNVAHRQCVLFVRENYWTVQDIPGAGGTFLNAQPVEGPTYLQTGDVITLGTGPQAPTLVIDPDGAAAGRKGYVRAGGPSPAPSDPDTADDQPSAQVAAAAELTDEEYPAEPVFAGGSPDAQEPSELTAWDAQTAMGGRRRTLRRTKSRSGLGLALLLAAGAGAALAAAIHFNRSNRTPPLTAAAGPESPAPTTQPASAPTKTPPRPAKTRPARVVLTPPVVPTSNPAGPTDVGVVRPPSIFDIGNDTPSGERPTVAPLVRSPPAPPGATPPRSTTAPAPVASPGGDLAAAKVPPAALTWKQVEQARNSSEPAAAIVVFDEYALQHPGTFADQLRRLTDEAMEKLWWSRVTELTSVRSALAQRLSSEPTPAAPSAKAEAVQKELSQGLGYLSDDPLPKMSDDTAAQRVREERDAAQYSRWRAQTLKFIRKSHGKLPWTDDSR